MRSTFLRLLFYALLPFTGAILLIDWLGVRVIHQNGLAFLIHVYSFGATFLISATTSFLFMRKYFQAKLWKPVLLSIAIAFLWWLSTFVILFYFHGLFGGTY